MGSPATVSLHQVSTAASMRAGVVIEADHVDDIVERAARRLHHVLEPVIAEARLRHVVGGRHHRTLIVGGDDAAGEEVVALAAGGGDGEVPSSSRSPQVSRPACRRTLRGRSTRTTTSRFGLWPPHHAERGPRRIGLGEHLAAGGECGIHRARVLVKGHHVEHGRPCQRRLLPGLHERGRRRSASGPPRHPRPSPGRRRSRSPGLRGTRDRRP